MIFQELHQGFHTTPGDIQLKWPAKRITESSTKSFGMYEKAIPMMEQGIDVIHLEVGMPSFDTPAHIKEAAKQALDDEQVHYSDFRGLQKFREALAEKVWERNHVEADAEEILVCSGVTHAAFAICMAALDEGDEVIVLDPYYPQHVNKIELPGMKERTLTMYAFTKTYAMDGWRMGYIAADRKFMPAILKITKNDIAHLNTFIQEGGYAAVKGSQDCVRQMVVEDKRRGDLVVRRMNAMPGVSCKTPEGTIYAFPDVSATGLPSGQIADELLEQAHVVVEEGAFYGANGEGHPRICFGAEPIERIEEAVDRLEEYFTKLMQERGQI